MTPARRGSTWPEVSFARTTRVRHRTRRTGQYVDALAGPAEADRGNYSPLALPVYLTWRYDCPHRTNVPWEQDRRT
jgi:hypothetical protein